MRCIGRAILTLAMAAAAACMALPCRPQSERLSLRANLPNPLIFNNGLPVATRAEWQRRRLQLLHMFTEQMYGRMPGRPPHMRFQVYDRDPHALGGKAMREQVAINFDGHPPGRPAGRRMDLLLYIPNGVRRPPVILGLNFWGNETINADPGIRISDRWIESGRNPFVDLSCVSGHKATAACRGIDAQRWPVQMILNAGYALATAYRGDFDPDRIGGDSESIRSAYPELAQGKRSSAMSRARVEQSSSIIRAARRSCT